MNRLQHLTLVISLFVVSIAGFFCTAHRNLPEFSWPDAGFEQRPWTYWWWPGSAVDKDNLTANLEDMASAGMGGVHVIPIYGVNGYEDRFIPYLSPSWMQMLNHAASEASRLGMGLDMSTGTGWPFGGPNVTPDNAASMVKIEKMNTGGMKFFRKAFTAGILEGAAAFSSDGECIDLTEAIDAANNQLSWRVPEGRWDIYCVLCSGTGQQVKRAAPGGEGNVMDYFSVSALNHYLGRFDSAFSSIVPCPVRAFYNDSFEVYNSNWTPGFFKEFENRRGYDLINYLPYLAGQGDDDTSARVRHDYNETISDLLLECFTVPWVDWSHNHGSITRNQAHGSPGNLLDLYSAADIPETEAFGPSGFPIPGLRKDSSIPEQFGHPDFFVEKFASSAAHVSGKKRVSSESCTWLGEHFQVALSQVKPEIDALFLAGVNHVFFHGMAYSPMEAPWPGWLFYASTNFARTGSFRKDLPELTSYITRCQSFLQSGNPDNDVLLYWPVHDVWRKTADNDMLHHFQVHNAVEWLYGTPFYQTAAYLKENGYAFDYCSDRQIEHFQLDRDTNKIAGTSSRTIIVPECHYMPLETISALANLAGKGLNIVFIGALPTDVPGMKNLESDRKRFNEELQKLTKLFSSSERRNTVQSSNVSISDNGHIADVLDSIGIIREPVTDKGVQCIRRRFEDGWCYFLANLGAKPVDEWIALGTGAGSAVFFDPVSGRSGLAALRKGIRENTEVYLQLSPGESMLLRTYSAKRMKGPAWESSFPAGKACDITGTWNVTFTDGGPVLPMPYETKQLISWTQFPDSNTVSFHGTARYSIEFELPASPADDWILDLGRVCESARVTVNGNYAGCVWSLPFRIHVGRYLKKGVNTFEFDVTNLAANRIADMDRRGVRWKVFKDINYVDIQYKPFDASSWAAMDSGIMGPVALIPVSTKKHP